MMVLTTAQVVELWAEDLRDPGSNHSSSSLYHLEMLREERKLTRPKFSGYNCKVM